MDQLSSDGFADRDDDDDVTADAAAATGLPDSIPAKKLKDGSITFEVTIRHLIEQTLLHALKRPEFRKTKLVVTSEGEPDSADDDPVMSSSPFVALESGCDGRNRSSSNYSTPNHSARAAAVADGGAEAVCVDPFSPSSTVPDQDSVEATDLPVAMAAGGVSQNNAGAGGPSGMPIKLRMKRTYSNSLMQTRGSLDEPGTVSPSSRPGSTTTLTASEGVSPYPAHVEPPRSVDAHGTSHVGRDTSRSCGTTSNVSGGVTVRTSTNGNGNMGLSAADECVALDLSMRSTPALASSQRPQTHCSDTPCLATSLPSWNRAPVRSCDIVHYSEAESALEQLATVAAAAAAAVTTSSSEAGIRCSSRPTTPAYPKGGEQH